MSNAGYIMHRAVRGALNKINVTSGVAEWRISIIELPSCRVFTIYEIYCLPTLYFMFDICARAAYAVPNWKQGKRTYAATKREWHLLPTVGTRRVSGTCGFPRRLCSLHTCRLGILRAIHLRVRSGRQYSPWGTIHTLAHRRPRLYKSHCALAFPQRCCPEACHVWITSSKRVHLRAEGSRKML